MNDHADLIARLERATGPDRDLDREIGIKTLDWIVTSLSGQGDVLYIDGSYYVDDPRGEFPSPTESLEVALTLVHDDLFWLIAKGRIKPEEPLYGAQICKASLAVAGQIIAEAEHNCLAIAVCIAALKARNNP